MTGMDLDKLYSLIPQVQTFTFSTRPQVLITIIHIFSVFHLKYFIPKLTLCKTGASLTI